MSRNYPMVPSQSRWPPFARNNLINVRGSDCVAYLFQYGGQLVAHPIFGFRFPLFFPCAPPSNAGYPAGAVNRGRLLFGYFFFGEARKSD